MSKNIRERQRSVDVESLQPDQAESIGFELGKRITEITDRAAEEVNKLTQIYGFKAKVAIQFVDSKTGESVT